MANEDEAAIGFSGKFTRNGLLPRAGVVTRIPEGEDRCGVEPIEGAKLGDAWLFDPWLTGSGGLKERAGSGVAGGGATRAICAAHPSRRGMASE